MSATNETGFRETSKPGAQPSSATGETVLLSVEEAAEAIGISPQAVRKRIAKGQLAARRDGRAWLVILERATSETAANETIATAAQPRTKPGAQPGNLVAAQQAEQMAALVASIQAPLLDRIETANREAERERGVRVRVTEERDELAAEVELLREIRHATAPDEDTDRFAPVSRSDEHAAAADATPHHRPSMLMAAWQWLRRSDDGRPESHIT